MKFSLLFCFFLKLFYSRVPKTAFSELIFFSTFPDFKTFHNNAGIIAGSIHQLIEYEFPIPKIYFFVNASKKELKETQKEEYASWLNVTIFFSVNFTSVITETMLKSKQYIYISPYYFFNHLSRELDYDANYKNNFSTALANGRKKILLLLLECANIYDNTTLILEACFFQSEKKIDSNIFGISKISKNSTKKDCYIHIDKQSIIHGAKFVDFRDNSFLKNSIKKSSSDLAIGVPTTSKSSGSNIMNHTLITTFFPSLNETLLIKEYSARIVVFLGFDSDDENFNNELWRKQLQIQSEKLISPHIRIVFLRLASLKRIAMTWNMIFLLASKLYNFDYYYQVNDDLNFISRGWFTKFVQTLKDAKNIGVVGPSDLLHNFCCKLLTQAFVHRNHLNIFSRLFYPIEFKDWKSDRWLTFVYGSKRTFCFKNFRVRNGGPARYSFCNNEFWKVILNKGKYRIQNFLKKNQTS